MENLVSQKDFPFFIYDFSSYILGSSSLLMPSDYSPFLLPGLTAGSPCLQASQFAGSIEATSMVASAIRGTPTSAFPEERSTIDAAATTFAPLACRAAT